ncbi:MAG: VWA domain-containing protein [Chloroflexaceae bacterium]|nr:VWA domain-containing protein [Chloroflexaceae bacterium]
MYRYMLLFISITGCVALAGWAAPVAAQTPPSNVHDVRVTQVDNSNYPEVTLYVAATDASGAPVGTLSAANFTLTEDGTPVEVTGFSGDGSIINAALVLDRSHSMDEDDKLEGAQDAAHAFVEQMRPFDQTALIAFASWSDIVQPFATSPEQLHDGIDAIELAGGTALYDAIIAGVDALQAVEGRRVLLVLSDGQDCRELRSYNCPAEYGSRAPVEAAIAYANEHEQPVYVVGLGSRDSISEPVLQRIAGETYGEYFYAPTADQLAELYARLAGNVQAEYALTYTSPAPLLRWHPPRYSGAGGHGSVGRHLYRAPPDQRAIQSAGRAGAGAASAGVAGAARCCPAAWLATVAAPYSRTRCCSRNDGAR